MTENKEGEEKEGRLFVLWILGESSVWSKRERAAGCVHTSQFAHVVANAAHNGHVVKYSQENGSSTHIAGSIFVLEAVSRAKILFSFGEKGNVDTW
jgi:hypothetical protein